MRARRPWRPRKAFRTASGDSLKYAHTESKLKMLKAFENSAAFSRVQLQAERTAAQPGTDPLLIEFIADYTDTVHAQL